MIRAWARLDTHVLALVRLLNLLEVLEVRGLAAEEADLVQHGQQAVGLLLEQVDAGLVVDEGDGRHVDALGRVLLHLHDEDVVVEEVLQLLVRVVDAHLLEGVELEDLEAEDV